VKLESHFLHLHIHVLQFWDKFLLLEVASSQHNMSVDTKLCLKFSIDKNHMGINNWLKDTILELALNSDISSLPTESENTPRTSETNLDRSSGVSGEHALQTENFF
jgi:hypothetical protein